MDPFTYIGGFISAHPYITMAILVGQWFASNVVAALPSPSLDSAPFYKFCFTLAHGLAGSFARVFPWLRVFSDSTQKDATFFKPSAPPDAPVVAPNPPAPEAPKP